MNCIVIDDEPLARLGMEAHIKMFGQLNLLGSFSNPLDATQILQQQQVDLIFLDINMPEISGLDFVKTLTNSPLIIFATAYPQYALDSYDLNAIDYLVKPIRFERFVKAVNKTINYVELLKSKDIQKIEFENTNSEIIYIKADRKLIKISIKDILYIEALKDYVVIFTKDQKIITAMNLKTIHNNLPMDVFFRISKSYIVNLNHISSLDNYSVFVGNNELPLSANYKEELMDVHINKNVIKKRD